MQQKKPYLLIAIFCLSLVSCSGKTKMKEEFKAKRNPSENEFIENGGYRIQLPKNPFLTTQETQEIYNKDANPSLKDIPKEIK